MPYLGTPMEVSLTITHHISLYLEKVSGSPSFVSSAMFKKHEFEALVQDSSRRV